MKVLIVIPAYNEALNIEKTVKDVTENTEYDYIIINDCSKDNTKEVCEKNNFNVAIYWYKEASTKIFDISKGGFYIKDCYDYIPYIGLCVSYDKLGDHEIANYYNNLAGKIKPDDEVYKNNYNYFSTLL